MVRERHLKLGKTKAKGAADKTMRALRAWWNTVRREDDELGESPTINVAWFMRCEALFPTNAVKFPPHGLRATFIGAGHAAGVSNRYVQLLANHKLHGGDVYGGYVLEDDLPALRAATRSRALASDVQRKRLP